MTDTTDQSTFDLGPLSAAIQRASRGRQALLDWADTLSEFEELVTFVEWFGIHEA